MISLSEVAAGDEMKTAQIKCIILPPMNRSAVGWHWSHTGYGSCWQAAGSPTLQKNAGLSCHAHTQLKPCCWNLASRRWRPVIRKCGQVRQSQYGIIFSAAQLYLSHWNDNMALTSILTGKTQVVLRKTDLAKCVKVAEGHPQVALMHL